MPVYNKLVRDNIPSIIEENGQKCKVEKLKSVDFVKELKNKFQEELDEYLETDSDNDAIEELADILEIIHTLTI
ncbi:nucleoside triphosphate pyrophosphohydrolase [Gracilibacillus massiliensis]|uniref:nucleoside triphosphate pyrophosphohydrolase n=1 Tax=Gracilibacillus massiliensis TaxID=1564956 RepID=UPI00071CEFE5|nr:nucleoside triphosphate pyrophosphohydrolase [Gracilibacillus massiliensis]